MLDRAASHGCKVGVRSHTTYHMPAEALLLWLRGRLILERMGVNDADRKEEMQREVQEREEGG